MRTFIAISLHQDIISELSGFIKGLSTLDSSVRWVRPENIHLTLKFLGEVKDDRVAKIADALNDTVVTHRPFTISIRGTGCFPNCKSPRVLWVGVDTSEQLQRLFQDLQEACYNLGFERHQKGFTPHLTLGRVKSTVKKELTTFFDKYRQYHWGEGAVDSIYLMKSLLRPEGPVYSVIAKLPLSKP